MRYVVAVGNEAAGADTNLAYTAYDCQGGGIDEPKIVAQLIAATQYQVMASGSYVRQVEVQPLGGGPGLPLPFPTAEYAALQAEDSDILPMDEYGVAFGSGPLAPLGAGMVLSRRSLTPGRSGRGRITSPWLRATAVSAAGVATNEAAAFMQFGYRVYVMGDTTGTALTQVIATIPTIMPANAYVVAATVSTRLGRLRSRTR